MNTTPTRDEVGALRRATGMAVLDCRNLLRDATPAFREKLLVAARTQAGVNFLRDPIEDDPALAAAFAAARRDATRLVDDFVAAERTRLAADGMSHMEFMLRSTCNPHWRHMKRILKERHDLDWLTPAEMNPGSRFD